MATGTQVPWTTPGATPCCCDENNFLPGPTIGCPTGTGQLQLTREQALAIKSNVTISHNFTASARYTAIRDNFWRDEIYIVYPSGSISYSNCAGTFINTCSRQINCGTVSNNNSAIITFINSTGAYWSGDYRPISYGATASLYVVEQGTDPFKTFFLDFDYSFGGSMSAPSLDGFYRIDIATSGVLLAEFPVSVVVPGIGTMTKTFAMRGSGRGVIDSQSITASASATMTITFPAP